MKMAQIFPEAQTVEHDASNTIIMGSIPRESNTNASLYLKSNARCFYPNWNEKNHSLHAFKVFPNNNIIYCKAFVGESAVYM